MVAMVTGDNKTTAFVLGLLHFDWTHPTYTPVVLWTHPPLWLYSGPPIYSGYTLGFCCALGLPSIVIYPTLLWFLNIDTHHPLWLYTLYPGFTLDLSSTLVVNPHIVTDKTIVTNIIMILLQLKSTMKL